MDAADGTLNASGIRGLDNSTGAPFDEHFGELLQPASRPANPKPGGFAKANGMGDIEALCDAAPLEIGNRIWSDTNGNGIQDPGEAGIDGVTVQLLDATRRHDAARHRGDLRRRPVLLPHRLHGLEPHRQHRRRARLPHRLRDSRGHRSQLLVGPARRA